MSDLLHAVAGFVVLPGALVLAAAIIAGCVALAVELRGGAR